MKNYILHTNEDSRRIRRTARADALYELFDVEGVDDCFVLVARGNGGFYCGTLYASEEEAVAIFDEIAESETPPYAIFDIVGDTRWKNILYK